MIQLANKKSIYRRKPNIYSSVAQNEVVLNGLFAADEN